MTRYFLYAVFALIQLLNAVSATAVSVAFPQVAADFRASVSLAAWVLGATQLGVLALGLVAGGMTEVIGKKRVATIALSLLSAGALASLLAPSIYVLIVARFAVGAATSAISLVFIALAAGLFPESRQKAIGLMASASFIGMVIGPNLGGWFTEALGWRWVFGFSLPIGVIGVVICNVMLPPDAKKAGSRTVNLKAAAIFAASMSFLMVGLSSFGNLGKGLPAWIDGLFVATGVLLLLGFVRHEFRSSHPLVDQEMLRRKPFVASNLFNISYGFVWGMSGLVPLYAVSIYGLTTLQSGLAVTPWTVALLSSTTLASFLVGRTGYRTPMVAGSIAMIVAFFLLGLEVKGLALGGLHLGGSGFLLFVMGLMGLGAGFALPSINNVCADLVPDRIASLMGVKYTFRTVGSGLGIAVASALLGLFGLAQGFRIVMIGVAASMALALPAIYMMPRLPSDR